jgi:hypothetical protein
MEAAITPGEAGCQSPPRATRAKKKAPAPYAAPMKTAVISGTIVHAHSSPRVARKAPQDQQRWDLAVSIQTAVVGSHSRTRGGAPGLRSGSRKNRDRIAEKVIPRA